MSRRKQYLEEIEETLFRAHRAIVQIQPSDEWQRALMVDIRGLGALGGEHDAVAAYNRVAWRFLAAACAVALVLFAFAYTNDFVANKDLAVSLLQDPLATYMP